MSEFNFDAIVIGAGHAGIEAGLALSRLGHKTLVLAISLESVGFLACNPSIGGTAKGHLVREIDALGGHMGVAADATLTQLRMLNSSKGFAVQSLRAQVDKHEYHRFCKSVLEGQDNLQLRQGEAVSVTPIYCGEGTFGTFGACEAGEAVCGADFDLASKNAKNSGESCAFIGGVGQGGSSGSYVHTYQNSENNEEYCTVAKVAANEGKVKNGCERGEVCGYQVITKQLKYSAKIVVFACGVYLKSKILIGETVEQTGPSGFKRAENLSDSLATLGVKMRRFKTGTPARIKKSTVDLSLLEVQSGEKQPYSFSDISGKAATKAQKQVCYLGYTNPKTHQIIAENLHKTPRKLGNTEGIGARYCPSIEDKIERFDRDRHQFFLESEGENTQEMYVQGISTSLPASVQLAVYRSLLGFENAQIMRDAYAIEYDCIDSTQLLPTLMHKNHRGLFFAGQINGTSGYEEAAAQGLIAGINAARFLSGDAPIVMQRDSSYIGVMIDDLVTKGTDEPYRMMTSRAEFRLHLRQDNADLRLTETGRNIGLVDEKRYKLYQKKLKHIAKIEKLFLQKLYQTTAKTTKIAEKVDIGAVTREDAGLVKTEKITEKVDVLDKAVGEGLTLEQYIKRHDVTLSDVKNLQILHGFLPSAVREVFVRLRYEGYIQREQRTRHEQLRLEKMVIPADVDYRNISGLRTEAAEKLSAVRPHSIGQASRISGVNPADITVLIVRLKDKLAKTDLTQE